MTTGFIYHGSAQNLYDEVFPKLKNFNPKIRTLIVLSESFSRELLKEIFTKAWTNFKIFDIVIIFDQEFKRYFEPFSIYAFNTFEASHQNQLFEAKFSGEASEGLESFERFQTNRNSNLNGYQLKVVLFQFMMVCEGTEYPNGTYKIDTLKYQDAEALKIMSKFANFSINFVKSSDGVKHGYQSSNYTFTGSLGMVEYEKADLAANARLVAEYNTTNTLCLFPTNTVKLKFAVPMKLSSEVKILVSLYNFLDGYLKISILAMFLVIPLILFFFDYITGSKKLSIDAMIRNYLITYSVMTFVSISMPRYWPSRYVMGSVVLVWLIIGNTCAGKMIEFLNTNFGLKQISSIDEMSRTSLEVKIPYPMAILFEGEFDDAPKSHLFINKLVKVARALESVGDKMAFIDVDNMEEMIRSRKYALLFLDNILDFLEKSFYDDNGNDIMTHIEETPYEYFYAMSVPKTSPFVLRFNELLMRMFEAGVAKYQMSSAKGGNDLIYIRRLKAGAIPSDGVKAISLNQIFSVFSLYMCAMTCAVLVLILEIIFSNSRKRIWTGLGRVYKC